VNYRFKNDRTLRQLGAGLLLATLALSCGSISPCRADDGNQNNNEVRLRTRLSGAPINGKTPEGQADFRMDSSRNRSRLNVEVENVNLAAGTVLKVVVTLAGVPTTVGSITLNAFGAGELELNSQDGDTVPAIVAGDMIAVKNGTMTILAGVF